MTRLQFMVLVVAASLAAFVGAFVASGTLTPTQVLAQPADPKPGETMRVSGIELVDDKGRVRASLQVADDGEVRFDLLDNDARPKVTLTATKERASFTITGSGKAPNFAILDFDDGQDQASMMAMSGVKDRPVLSWQHRGHRDEQKAKFEESLFGASDRQGNPRCILGWNGQDSSMLQFADKDGRDLVGLVAIPGKGSVLSIDGAGAPAVISARCNDSEVGLSVFAPGNASIQMKHDKVVRFGAVTSEDGRPILRAFDAKGKETWAVRPEDE